MAYKVIILYRLYMPSYVLGTFTEYPYGTFDLSDEPLFDPPHVFAAEARKRDMPVLLPELGEIVKLSHQR